MCLYKNTHFYFLLNLLGKWPDLHINFRKCSWLHWDFTCLENIKLIGIDDIFVTSWRSVLQQWVLPLKMDIWSLVCEKAQVTELHTCVRCTLYSVLSGVTIEADSGMAIYGQCWGQVKSAHCTEPLNLCKVCVLYEWCAAAVTIVTSGLYVQRINSHERPIISLPAFPASS